MFETKYVAKYRTVIAIPITKVFIQVPPSECYGPLGTPVAKVPRTIYPSDLVVYGSVERGFQLAWAVTQPSFFVRQGTREQPLPLIQFSLLRGNNLQNLLASSTVLLYRRD